jgi:hypothetical protein
VWSSTRFITGVCGFLIFNFVSMSGKKNVIDGRPVRPVSEIPYYPPGTRIPKEDVRKYGLNSVYRYMVARGRGASRKDFTWNGKEHTCCHCKYPWRHFATCKHARPNWSDDLGDVK